MNPRKSLPWMATLTLAAAITGAPVFAQTSPTKAPPAEASHETIVLSPFEVRSTDAGGYDVTDSNSALKIAVNTKDLPFSLSVLSADMMKDFATMDEVEALRLNASVNPVENFISKSQNRPFIRGTSSVRVYTDGMFMNSLQTPSVAVDRVEILKGTSGTLFGLGEPGGTLNYVYKPALAQSRGSLHAGIGSWGENFARVDLGGPVSKDGKLTSRFGLGYHTGNTHVEYTKFETRELFARLRYAFKPNTTLQVTLAHSNRNTDSPSYLQWNGYAGRHNPNNEAIIAQRYASYGADPMTSGLLNRRSNNNTPDSFSSLATTSYSAEFNHAFSSRWFLRASASRAHMDRDSLITAKFTNAPVNAAGTTRAPSPTTGVIEVVPTVRGDLLASPDGQLAYDNLASDAAQINLLGHFDFNRVSWKVVFGADYNKEVFYGDRWRSNWWYSQNASERSVVLPAAQRIQPVVANILNPAAGFNTAYATPPLSTFTIADGNFTNTAKGNGYYWINHVKLLDEKLIFTGSVRRDEPTLVNDQYFQLSRRSVVTGEADQFKTTYSVGAVYNLTKKFSLYANDGSTFRPQVSLLRGRDQNFRLADPISGSGGDVGFRLDLPRQKMRLSAGLYRVRQENLIVNMSEFQEDTGTTLQWQEQSGKNEVTGYELELSANITPSLSVNLSYAHLNSEVKSNLAVPAQVGQELAQTPEDTIVLLARYKLTKSLSVGGSYTLVSDDKIYTSGPNAILLNRTYVEGYDFCDLFVSHDWKISQAHRLRTQLNVYNVLDKVYASEFGLSKPIGFRLSTTLSW